MTYRAFLLSMVTLALLSTMGCSTGRRGGLILDSGPSGDTSTDTMADDSAVLLDTSARPDTSAPDTSVVVMDTGTPDTGRPDTGRPDTGRPDTGTPDTGTTCGFNEVASVTGAYCDISADTCVRACASGDGVCVDNCLDAGGTDCLACVLVNTQACFNDNGCQTAWNNWVCCLEDNCGPSPRAESCVTSARTGVCASQISALDVCSMSVDVNAACPNWYADCF